MRKQNSKQQAVKQEKLPAYKNRRLPVDLRTKDLLSRMTVEEKVAQMLCVWGQKKDFFFDETENLNLDSLSSHLKDGIGQIARLSDTGGGLDAAETAELANSIQKIFMEESRLGIPVIFHEECLHGLAGKNATSYPQPIGLASTFNTSLIEEIFTSIAEDARMRGAHQALTPVVDVARDPRWGRVEETFGEDPFLVAQMGIAAVRGLQGRTGFPDKKHIIATLKHFAAHGQPESGTNCAPGNFSERVLRDTFLYPFKEAIDKGKALSVMASYNEIDGVPSHASKWLLRDLLRKEWNFKGVVVSDYYAITELNDREEATSHSIAENKKEAARLAAEAGVNIELPDIDCYPYLVDLVKEKSLKKKTLDDLVAGLLKYKFQLGLFENPYMDISSINNSEKLEKDRSLALRAARETIILLKNENNLLPLNPDKEYTIAVIGPNANRKVLGGYSGEPKYYTTVLEGISERAGRKVKILYSEGCKLTVGGSWNDDEITLPDPEENKILIAEALATAEKADVVVLVVGGNEQTSREAWNRSHLGDRTNLDLFGMQNELVEAVHKTGKPVVAVLFHGRPNSINYIKENIHAVLDCWYLGQEAGTAVAEAIFGDCNPSGKLPISVPRSAGHIPCYYNHKPSARRGYLFDDATPLFPFGFGLSYTQFRIENIALSRSRIKVNQTAEISAVVKNTGQLDGAEVVQLYIRDCVSSVTRPVKELKGFKKIWLKAGESEKVKFSITPELLAFTNINMEYTVEPGEFDLMLGSSSRDEDLVKIKLNVI